MDKAVYGLARYTCICQVDGLVSIAEPKILIDGIHEIEITAAVQERVP